MMWPYTLQEQDLQRSKQHITRCGIYNRNEVDFWKIKHFSGLISLLLACLVKILNRLIFCSSFSYSTRTNAHKIPWKTFGCFFANVFPKLQLFLLFNCAMSSHVSNNPHPCKTNGIFLKSANSSDQCIVWSDDVVPDICSAGTQSRIRILKHIFLFHELHPLSLFEVFSVGMSNLEVWQLQTGVNGADCILGSITRCTSCFKRISATLRDLNEAYRSFDVTLSRFDCLPAVDTASATRPFSPNATCYNCKVWYRRWLLVQSLNIWLRAPCINWCYYTQLACPHLAPAKLWDYAGHPSFQCRDMDIDSWRHECNCIHPCDVRGIVAPGIFGKAPSVQHDFFAAEIHCATRRKECRTYSQQIRRTKRNEDYAISSSKKLAIAFLLLQVTLF